MNVYFFSSFFFQIQQLYCPSGISLMEKSGPSLGESQLRWSRATQLTVHAGFVSVFHNTPTSDKDYMTFNVRVIFLHACTRG